MAEGRRKGDTFRKKSQGASIVLTWMFLIMMLSTRSQGMAVSSQDADGNLVGTESILVPVTDKTSNVILPETGKKHGTKKLDLLEKEQLKRSNNAKLVAVNGSLSLSIDSSTSSAPETTTLDDQFYSDWPTTTVSSSPDTEATKSSTISEKSTSITADSTDETTKFVETEESETESNGILSTNTELGITTTEFEPDVYTTLSDEEQSTMTPPCTTEPETTLPLTAQSTTLITTETMGTTSVQPVTTATTTTSTTEMTTTTSTTTTTTTMTTPSIPMTATTEEASTTPVTTTSVSTTSTTITSPITTLSSTIEKKSTTSAVSETPSSLENQTGAISPTRATKQVTLLVRIIFKGNWDDICNKTKLIRQSLVQLVNNGNTEKNITTQQIVFYQTQCAENSKTVISLSENSETPLLLYVIDEYDNYDENLTKKLPSLYKNQTNPVAFPLPILSFELIDALEAESVASESGSTTTIVVILSCVGFVCIILLAGLLFIVKKRQGRFNYGERCRPVSLDAYSLDNVSAYSSVRRSKLSLRFSKRSYGNPTFEDSSTVPSHPLNYAGLAAFSNELNGIAEEFSGIPQVSSKIDELPPGAELKNRYANVIPLPETRVPLQRLNNDPLTEYINASYVRGPKNANKYYIASQAPTETTVCDFWRMIWEQQVKVIIMLTDLVENGVEKCVEYVPPLEVTDCHRLYGDYQVTLKKREAKDKYAISSLHLKNLESNTFREVNHIWYLWPANGVPSDPSGLIAVLLEARALQRGAGSPILVHCSPGTGRTGCFIALDLAIRQYEITRTVDVPRVVYTIRRDRAGAVQTREQYTLIYKALYMYASKLTGGTVDST